MAVPHERGTPVYRSQGGGLLKAVGGTSLNLEENREGRSMARS